MVKPRGGVNGEGFIGAVAGVDSRRPNAGRYSKRSATN